MSDEEKTTAAGARLAVIEAKIARYHQRAAEGRVAAYEAVAYGVEEDERTGQPPDQAAVAALAAGCQAYERAVLKGMLDYADEALGVGLSRLQAARAYAESDDSGQRKMVLDRALATIEALVETCRKLQ